MLTWIQSLCSHTNGRLNSSMPKVTTGQEASALQLMTKQKAQFVYAEGRNRSRGLSLAVNYKTESSIRLCRRSGQVKRSKPCSWWQWYLSVKLAVSQLVKKHPFRGPWQLIIFFSRFRYFTLCSVVRFRITSVSLRNITNSLSEGLPQGFFH
jgi:hypothetical protein